MGINKNDATSFEEMAQEQETPVTEATAPVAETTEPTEAGDKACDCTDCDCTAETPKAE